MTSEINRTMQAAIDSAPEGTSGLVIEPWTPGETYGVAADWSQAAGQVYFYGERGWRSTQWQVADFRHRQYEALSAQLQETLDICNDDDEDAADLAAEAVEF